MLGKTLYAAIIFFNLYFAYEPKSISLSFDAINQFEYTLNEINPYTQSNLKIGVFKIEGLANLPYNKMYIDVDRIGAPDSLETLTLFNFTRGDYAFRQTSLMLNKNFNANRSITLKGTGRKFPGKNNNFGSDYILDNYLLDYVSESDLINLNLSNYYHKEDIQLPVINQNKSRFSEIFGFALNIESKMIENSNGNNYKIFANYQNLFFSGNEYNYSYDGFRFDNTSFINSFLNKNALNFGYISYPKSNLLIYVDFLINKISSKYSESLNKDYLYSTKIKMKYFINSFCNFDIGLHQHNSDFGEFLELFYKLKVTFEKSSLLKEISFARDYDFDEINVVENLNYNIYYDMLNILLAKKKISINLSLFKIHLLSKSSSILDENGGLINIAFGYNNKGSSVELVLHKYLDYSPIDYNFSINSFYKYNVPNKKYSIFSNLSYNFIMLRPEFSLILENTGIWGENTSNKVLSYPTSKLEFGIAFEDFIISYNFLNRSEEINFSEYGSNLDNPIYQMNYLNIKWQFHN